MVEHSDPFITSDALVGFDLALIRSNRCLQGAVGQTKRLIRDGINVRRGAVAWTTPTA
jgi:hypothetical protein